ERHDLVGARDRLEGPGHGLDAGRRRRRAVRDLVAHHLDSVGWRADPRRAALADGAGEVRVLGEEPVPGMDGLGTAARDHVDDGVRVQVALRSRLAAERVRLVGVPHVRGVAVELGVHGDRRHAELAARAHDADRDLASVGDEQLAERRGGHGLLLERLDGGRILRAMPAGGGVERTYPGRWFDCLDSTSRYVLDEARRGAPEGLVAVADFQTAGRGRRGRGWVAPPGASLLASVLLRPALAPERTPLVSMACGAAMA